MLIQALRSRLVGQWGTRTGIARPWRKTESCPFKPFIAALTLLRRDGAVKVTACRA